MVNRLVAIVTEGEFCIGWRVIEIHIAGNLRSRLGGFNRVYRLVGVLLLGFDLKRCEDRIGRTVKIGNRYWNIHAVARLGVARSGRGDHTVLIHAGLPAIDLRGYGIALGRIINEVTIGNLGVVSDERVHRLTRSGGLLFVLRLVYLILACNGDHSGDGGIGGTVLVSHAHWNIRMRSRQYIGGNRGGDFTRLRIDLYILKVQVTRGRNVGRIIRVRDDGEGWLRVIVNVRAVDGAGDARSRLAGNRWVRRAIGRRVGIHHSEFCWHLRRGTVRIGYFNVNLHAGAGGDVRVRSSGNRTVVINGEGPVGRQILWQLVLAQGGIR